MSRNKSEKVAPLLRGLAPALLDYLRMEALQSNIEERRRIYMGSKALRLGYQRLGYRGRVAMRRLLQREAGREPRTDGMFPGRPPL